MLPISLGIVNDNRWPSAMPITSHAIEIWSRYFEQVIFLGVVGIYHGKKLFSAAHAGS